MKLLQVERHVPQCPIAGDATVEAHFISQCSLLTTVSACPTQTQLMWTGICFAAVWC